MILTTHNVGYLQLANNIVVLGKDETTAQQGSPKQLQDQEGYIKSLLLMPVADMATGVLSELEESHILSTPAKTTAADAD